MTRALLGALLIVGLAATPAPAAPKIVVFAFETRGEGLEGLAAAATRGAVSALDALPGVTASVVRDASAGVTERRYLGAGELGQQIAEATGADLVVQGVLVRGDLGRLLLCLSGHHAARRELLLLDPLCLDSAAEDVATELEMAAGQHLARAWRRWTLPVGDVTEVSGGGSQQLVRVQLTSALPAGETRFELWLRPEAIQAPATGERFAAAPRRLGVGTVARSEAGSSWFELEGAPAVEAGASVVVAPVGWMSAPDGGPGMVVATRPRGAVVALNGVVYGATPLWLPLPADGAAELQLSHPLALGWRQAVDDETRAAGLLAVTLAAAAEAVAATPGPGVVVRVESLPSGAEVWVDGARRGVTPLRLEGITGRPMVTVRREGYEPWSGQILATGPLTVRAELVPSFGGLEVVTTPTGAELFVDGRRQGVTPVRLTGVPVGRHQVRVVPADGQAVVREVVLAPGQLARIEIEFEAAPGPRTPPPAPPAPATSPEPPERPALPPHRVVMERKVRSPDGTLHLVVARLAQGALVSLTLSPPRATTTQAVEGGYEVRFADWRPERLTWAIRGVAELRGIGVVPGGESAGVVQLTTADGARVRVHESSTAERLRLVIESGP